METKVKVCPSCKAEHNTAIRRCGCGYEWKHEARERRDVDQMWGRCAWESDGLRCGNAGTVAEGTQGSDRWYCTAHDGCKSGAIGHQIVLESLRGNPNPDFSLEARRAASLRKVEQAVPEVLRGWSQDEYRENARHLIRQFSMAARSGK